MTGELESAATNPAAPVVIQKRGGLTVAAIAGVMSLAVVSIGFFSTYIFVTKLEMSEHKTEATAVTHKLETDQKLTDVSIESVTKEMKGVKEDVQEVKLEQRLTNKNLEKLLLRSRIVPASIEDMRIEIERDP